MKRKEPALNNSGSGVRLAGPDLSPRNKISPNPGISGLTERLPGFTEQIMAEDINIRVVVAKDEMVRDLSELRGVTEEYAAFLDRQAQGEGWRDDALAMVHDHYKLLAKKRVSLRTFGLVSTILRQMLGRLKSDQFTLHLTGQR